MRSLCASSSPFRRLATPLLLATFWSAVSCAADPSEFNVTLLITRSVRGSVYMVGDGSDPAVKKGQECPPYAVDPCTCVGGAARRQTVLERARTDDNTLVIDTGGYFAGSGLFYPTFRGNASRDMFAATGYNSPS